MRIRSQEGFSLFELIVAIAIVGLMMGLVVGQMDKALDLDMKRSANKLGTTIRYLYNKAATEGLYIRLVFNINERSYWVESTTDPTKVSADMQVAGEQGEEAKEGETGDEKPKLKYAQPRFGKVDSFLLKPTKLPDRVFIKDIFVEHRPSSVQDGIVGIYFFPNGYVEQAIINLRNEEDDFYYHIETNPISGAVKIGTEYKIMEGK